MVTDYSKLPRETYYACPHCMLRLELLLDSSGKQDGLGHLRVRPVDDDGMIVSRLEGGGTVERLGQGVSSAVASRPSKSCRHFLGYLRCLPESAGIPDECAVCPNIMQCYIKRE